MSTIRRLSLALAAVALFAAACGDAGTEPAPAATEAPAATTDQPAATTADTAPAVAEAAPVESGSPPLLASTIDGPEAPDFALTLGTGTDRFVLGEVNKPVYLIYWADW